MSERRGWYPEEEPGKERHRPRGAEGEGDPGEAAGGASEEPDPEAGRGGEPGPGPARPPRGLESRDRPKVASRYSLFVGLAFVVLAIVAVVNAISTDEGGVLGTDPDSNRGQALAEFAAPDALSDLVGDANIDQDDCESSRNPCPADQVRVPACEVELEGAIRVCDAFDKPLAISFWFTLGGDCLPTQDAFDRVATERGEEVNFLSVNVLDDREEVTQLIRDRSWEVPVAHDTDGAVSNIYGVGVCPTVLLAYPGGILHAAEIKPGNFDAAEIDAMVDDLLEASAARELDGARG